MIKNKGLRLFKELVCRSAQKVKKNTNKRKNREPKMIKRVSHP